MKKFIYQCLDDESYDALAGLPATPEPADHSYVMAEDYRDRRFVVVPALRHAEVFRDRSHDSYWTRQLALIPVNLAKNAGRAEADHAAANRAVHRAVDHVA